MNLVIRQKCKLKLPINLEKRINKIINSIPKNYLINLKYIDLYDDLSLKGDQECAGLYIDNIGNSMAKIDLGINGVFAIYKKLPKVIYFLPFITNFLLARTIYHEIGHHVQRNKYNLKKRDYEKDADKFRNKMLTIKYKYIISIMKPLKPLNDKFVQIYKS